VTKEPGAWDRQSRMGGRRLEIFQYSKDDFSKKCQCRKNDFTMKYQYEMSGQ
jgi:hypothetical protein